MNTSYLKMIRPLNSFMSGIGVVFSILAYSSYSIDYGKALLMLAGFTTGFTATAASMLVNDIVDVEVDRVNKPWKPLPSGKAKVGTTWALTMILASVAVLVNVAVGWSLVAVTLIYLSIGVLYNFMRRYWWSQFMVSASTTGPIVYGYVASGLPEDSIVFTTLFALTIFTVNTGREVLKAVQDMEGDKSMGYNTIPLRIGVQPSLVILKAAGLLGPLLGVTAGLMGGASLAYITLISLAGYFYARSLFKACGKPGDKQVLESSRRNTLKAMMLGLLAFWVSRIGPAISL